MRYLRDFLYICILVFIDRMTKICAVRYLKPNGPVPIIRGVFELQYLENTGAAFGILKNRQILFIVGTLLIMAAVIWFYFKIPDNRRFLPLRIISTTVVAGAVGNLIDRVSQGYVVDFFYFKLIDFPIFNVADIYVTVSSVIFLFLMLFYYKEEDYRFLRGK